MCRLCATRHVSFGRSTRHLTYPKDPRGPCHLLHSARSVHMLCLQNLCIRTACVQIDGLCGAASKQKQELHFQCHKQKQELHFQCHRQTFQVAQAT
jgi:hypothetical protein